MDISSRPETRTPSLFFTVSLERRGDDLLIREIDRLRRAVQMTRAERPFRIDAFVILPDHLHTIWTLPEGDDDHTARWRLIKSRFSAALSAGTEGDGATGHRGRGIWMRRLWAHPLRGTDDFAQHLRGCWMDPVRHGLVDDPLHWPYSSFARRPRLDQAPLPAAPVLC